MRIVAVMWVMMRCRRHVRLASLTRSRHCLPETGCEHPNRNTVFFGECAAVLCSTSSLLFIIVYMYCVYWMWTLEECSGSAPVGGTLRLPASVSLVLV
ncbi:hypothetical protein F2P79_021945 [Pimephales promelas]|nr:hypothetical protein F2P79_021945 [Pimephales promelas]